MILLLLIEMGCARGLLHDLQTVAAYVGSGEYEKSLKMSFQIIHVIEESQAHQVAAVGNANLSVD